MCAGESVTVTATAENTTNPTFQWPQIEGHNTYEANNNTFSFTPTASGNYTVNAYGGNHCPANATVYITVDEAPAPFQLHCPGNISFGHTSVVSIRPLQTGEQIVWTSSDETIATVVADATAPHNAVVTGISVSQEPVRITATITKSDNNADCSELSDYCDITIVPQGLEVICPTSDQVPNIVYDGQSHSVTGYPITVKDADGNTLEPSDYTLTFEIEGQNQGVTAIRCGGGARGGDGDRNRLRAQQLSVQYGDCTASRARRRDGLHGLHGCDEPFQPTHFR